MLHFQKFLSGYRVMCDPWGFLWFVWLPPLKLPSWDPCPQGLLDPAIWLFLLLCWDPSPPSEARTKLVSNILFAMYPVPDWRRRCCRAPHPPPGSRLLLSLCCCSTQLAAGVYSRPASSALNLHSSLTRTRTPAVLSTSQGEGREEEMNGGSERGPGILLS